jgi:amino-acid N-acetyltransferase
MEYRKAQRADLAAIHALLQEGGLLAEDCAEQLGNFLVAEVGSEIVAIGALEICGSFGLVRSLAVTASHQGGGVAGKLLHLLEQKAVQGGLRALFLLTETSVEYFRKFGFEVLERSMAPDPIVATRQLGELCPAYAVLMTRDLIERAVA